ncbi:MAG TPA: oxidoreductase [Gemmatimonadaceae bacterium]|nr:oxidoreductase [Gemmatimonadaceae bacterium]
MTESARPIRVALIGYGYAGRTFHAPLIHATPGLSLSVIGSSDPVKVHADLPDVVVAPTPREAIAHDVELVVVATPNDTHAVIASAALAADKNVVVDKPFTVTLEEARHVVRTAERRGKLLSVFQNRRWDADFLAIQALVRDGRLGRVLHFESHIDRYRPDVRRRWREQAGPGSGIWYDLGPHLIDQTLHLFGRPSAVSATLVRQREEAQTDDWAHVVLDYGPLRAILHCSMLVPGGTPRLAVHGTRGSWIKHGMDVQERQLTARIAPGSADWGADPVPGVLHDGETSTRTEIPVPRGDYREYYARVRDALLGRGENPVPPAQALDVMAVLEAARESALAGRVMPAF